MESSTELQLPPPEQYRDSGEQVATDMSSEQLAPNHERHEKRPKKVEQSERRVKSTSIQPVVDNPSAQLPADQALTVIEDTPPVVPGSDRLPQTWLRVAEEAIARTSGDPHAQEQEIGYLRKQYQAKLGSSGDMAA